MSCSTRSDADHSPGPPSARQVGAQSGSKLIASARTPLYASPEGEDDDRTGTYPRKCRAERARLHEATDVGAVTLKVSNLSHALDFYRGLLGLQEMGEEDGVWLGAGERRIVRLREVPAARRPSPQATGLYHIAIRLPDRGSLAVKIAQLAAAGVPLGQADHLVSEAFYLSDPDGNGIELYRDRPRSEWEWDAGQVRMAADPIDTDGMFAEIRGGETALANVTMPDGTALGHMHLRVSDLAATEKFYVDVLGFDVAARWPGALFVSAGGYHHHLGLNTWQSRRGQPPPEPGTGLDEFSLVLPTQDELTRVAQRVAAAGYAVEPQDGTVVLTDPSQIRIRLALSAT